MSESLEDFPVDVIPTSVADVDDETFDEFVPLVIKGALTRASSRWTDEWLIERFGDDQCHVSLDSRPARGTFSTQMSLVSYLEGLESSGGDAESQGYLFHTRRDPRGTQDLLEVMDVPGPILELGGPALHRFYLGPALTGTLPHAHTSAINALARGRKRWAVYVGPTPQVNRALAEESRTRYDSGSQASDWFAVECPELRRRPRIQLWEFVQEAGDLVYIPRGFSHAVVNLQQVAGFTVEFGGGGPAVQQSDRPTMRRGVGLPGRQGDEPAPRRGMPERPMAARRRNGPMAR